MKHKIIQLLEPVYVISEQWFSVFLEQFSNQLTDKLIDKAEKSNTVSIKSDCFSALHRIKTTQNEAVSLFFTSLAENFCTTKNITENITDSSLKKNKLNLIATKDLEENLLFITAKDKLTDRNKEAFEHLEVRIFELLKNSGEHVAKNPLDAENILNAFRDSVEIIKFSPDIRLQTFKLFEQLLSQEIADLLEKLNNTLINQGILPTIETSYSLKKIKHKRARENKSPLPEITPSNELSSTSYNNAVTIPSVEPASIAQTSALNSRLLDLANQLTQTRIQNTAKNSTPLSEQVTKTNLKGQSNKPLPIDYSEQELIKPIRTASESPLNQLLRQTNNKNINSGDNILLSLEQNYAGKTQQIASLISSNIANQHTISTSELINTLKIIQSNLASGKDNKNYSNVLIQNEIKKNILTQTNKSPATTELHNNKLYLVNLIEDIFERISENSELSSTGQYLLRSLTLPIIQLALIDESFIGDKNHPARIFLDDFSNAALGLVDTQSKRNNPLYLKLKNIAYHLNHEQQINKAVFSQLHTDLKQFTANRKQQANTNSHSSRTAIEAKIDAIIKYCINGKQLPDGIILILNRIWKNVMLDIYSDDTCNEDDREKAAAFINSLIFSIKPAQTTIEKQRLEKIVPIINQELEDGLIRINYPYATKNKVVQYLDKFHSLALGIKASAVITPSISNNINYSAENKTINPKELETEAIANELILIDQNINIKASEKIANSLEEAFLETLDETNVESEIKAEVKTDLTSKEDNEAPFTAQAIEKQKANSPEKQSKTDFELIRLVNNSYNMPLIDDKYTQQARNLTEDSWLEFRFKSHYSRAKITWIEDKHSQFNFLTQNNRIINITLEALSDSFRQGISSEIQTSSVIDNAITTLHNETSNVNNAG